MVPGAAEADGAADPVGSGEGVAGVHAADSATSATGSSTRNLSADIPQVYVHPSTLATHRTGEGRRKGTFLTDVR
ncbi:hypothetical protein Cme02nite_56960 [Catellatospora methionotrophica]|uniref:Uncharacterized protein n=1 Tax=Catellatospora methionotrophica TaxID=121620 RepID=A0A8J3LKM3_9ACTN|nr:hypothetical protein Cme02nite_56960 [Catellatospora methionotrophica]